MSRRWIAQSRHFLVADEDGTILGAASMTDAGKVLLNYVSPDARFRGVSKALMLALEEHAAAAGIAACSLDSTQTALRFYQSLGYQRTGEGDIHPVTARAGARAMRSNCGLPAAALIWTWAIPPL